jgi:hypothetical protein
MNRAIAFFNEPPRRQGRQGRIEEAIARWRFADRFFISRKGAKTQRRRRGDRF